MKNQMNPQNLPEKILKESVEFLNDWDKGVNTDELLPAGGSADSDSRKTVSSLVYGCFRNRALLEHLIAKFARKAEGEIKNILLASMTQCFYQTGIPREIAASVAVDFSKRRHGQGVGGFVNAFLRKSLGLDLSAVERDAPENVRLKLPENLHAKWRGRWKHGQLAKFAELVTKKPDLSFRLLHQIPEPDLTASLCRRSKLPDWARGFDYFEASDPALILRGEWLKTGRIYVSDPSTALAPGMLAGVSRGPVLDMCSAPGGKTLALAQRLPEEALTISADSSMKRQGTSFANFASAGYAGRILTVAASAARPPFREGSFNGILIDVPCSNTGVFRHKPDVLWRYNDRRMGGLERLQGQLFDSAAALVSSGGHLCYSTCSIEDEENSGQVERFLASHKDFKLVDKRLLLPCEIHDGAYAALLKKIG